MSETISQEPTDVVSDRIIAQIIDIIAVPVVMAIVTFILGFLAGLLGFGVEAASQMGRVIGSITLTVGFFIYGVVLETAWDGQTIGKYLLDIRVVTENKKSISMKHAIIRNIPGLFTYVLVILGYIFALISIWESDKRQRTFDRIAGTIVLNSSPS